MSRRSDDAQRIWPHLADRPAPREQPRQRNLQAERMYPGLVPRKPKLSNPYRESLLRNLRAINGRHGRR
jgi:hypothetical protein